MPWEAQLQVVNVLPMLRGPGSQGVHCSISAFLDEWAWELLPEMLTSLFPSCGEPEWIGRQGSFSVARILSVI